LINFRSTTSMSEPRRKPLIVIVGPTASGKTALSIKLAKKFDGEIISADSRAIYRGMDIGTAKPTKKEQEGVPHWGIDLVEPDESFSAAQFKKYADQKIREIRSRQKIPFLVGGTGLYVDSVLFDFQFGLPSEDSKRKKLQEKTVEELQNYCIKNNIKLPENKQNKRYLVRAIENRNVSIIGKEEILNNTLVVGITTCKKYIRTRIEDRIEQIFSGGVVKETIGLVKKYGWTSEAMTGNIYRLVKRKLDGEINEEQLWQLAVANDYQLVKRQMTWLRRNPYIVWCDLDSAEQYISSRIIELTKNVVQ